MMNRYVLKNKTNEHKCNGLYYQSLDNGTVTYSSGLQNAYKFNSFTDAERFCNEIEHHSTLVFEIVAIHPIKIEYEEVIDL